jgi:hypothetical protein
MYVDCRFYLMQTETDAETETKTRRQGAKRRKTSSLKKVDETKGLQQLADCCIQKIASFLSIPDLPSWWRLSARFRDLSIYRSLSQTFLGPDVLSQLQVHIPLGDIAHLVIPSLKAQRKYRTTKRNDVYEEPPTLSQFIFRLEMETTKVSYILKARIVTDNSVDIHASHNTNEVNFNGEDIGIVIDLDPDLVPDQILEVCQVPGSYTAGGKLVEHIKAVLTETSNPWKFNVHVIDTRTAKTALLFGDCEMNGVSSCEAHHDTCFVEYDTYANNTIPAETRTNLHMSQIVRERLENNDTRMGRTSRIAWTGLYFQLYDLDETASTDMFLSPERSVAMFHSMTR